MQGISKLETDKITEVGKLTIDLEDLNTKEGSQKSWC
jgi:hypothetical protein